MPTPGLDGYAPPWLKPEHDDLAALARAFFTEQVLPHAERLERQGHPDREHYRRAGELGLLGLSVPEEYGGGGGDFTHEAVLLHEQTRCGEGSLGLAVHSGIVTATCATTAPRSRSGAGCPASAAATWSARSR